MQPNNIHMKRLLEKIDEQLENYLCPSGHIVQFARSNYEPDIFRNMSDPYSKEGHEEGLYCDNCKRSYDFSELEKFN